MSNTVTVVPKGGEKMLIRPEKVTMIIFQPIDPNNIGERIVTIVAEGPVVLNMPVSKFEETEFFKLGYVQGHFAQITPDV